MIELTLDSRQAALKDSVSVKLTRENVYFTKIGSYTYDIELPLNCAQNRSIFGNINRIELAKALPHWTINEFVTQIENFLGIVIEVDETSKRSRITPRDDWFSGSITYISDVVDEFSVEVDKYETTDISNGNVGWADMADGEEHVSDEIMQVATKDTATFASLDEMKSYLNAGHTNAELQEQKSKIFVVNGHQMILCSAVDENGKITEWYFKEVNQLGALMRVDKTDIDVELKIVPASTVKQNVPFVQTVYETSPLNANDKGYRETKIAEVQTDVLRIAGEEGVGEALQSTLSTASGSIDLQALIAGEASASDNGQEDKMYVAMVADSPTSAIITEDSAHMGQYPVVFPYPMLEAHKSWAGNSKATQKFYVSLRDYSDAETMASAISTKTVIDTTSKYCIKFISREVLKPTGLFVISNKRYACEKLEYSVTSRGVSPLVTGYFYKLD